LQVELIAPRALEFTNARIGEKLEYLSDDELLEQLLALNTDEVRTELQLEHMHVQQC
jgi:hypothetical protein